MDAPSQATAEEVEIVGVAEAPRTPTSAGSDNGVTNQQLLAMLQHIERNQKNEMTVSP